MNEVALRQDTGVMVLPEQVDLIRRTVAKDATKDELELYFYDCQRQGVHPLDKLIHFTKRGGRYVPITSIDFLRMKANSTKEYAGSDDAVTTGTPGAKGFEAKVNVYRMVQGQRCAWSATARWEEYFPGEQQGHMWKKMPHVMLSKCAEALALRKAFADVLHGLYIREELDQAEKPKPDTRTLKEKVQAKLVTVAPEGDGLEQLLSKKTLAAMQPSVERKLEKMADEIIESMSKQEDGLNSQPQAPLAVEAAPVSQDAPAPIIWNAGKTPEQDKVNGHRGKDIRKVPADYLIYYEKSGPQDEYRYKATAELNRRDAEKEQQQ